MSSRYILADNGTWHTISHGVWHSTDGVWLMFGSHYDCHGLVADVVDNGHLHIYEISDLFEPPLGPGDPLGPVLERCRSIDAEEGCSCGKLACTTCYPAHDEVRSTAPLRQRPRSRLIRRPLTRTFARCRCGNPGCLGVEVLRGVAETIAETQPLTQPDPPKRLDDGDIADWLDDCNLAPIGSEAAEMLGIAADHLRWAKQERQKAAMELFTALGENQTLYERMLAVTASDLSRAAAACRERPVRSRARKKWRETAERLDVLAEVLR